MAKILLIVVAALAVIVVVFALVTIGPSNLIGMLRYDSRHEGRLKVGDRAPDVSLCGLDGSSRVRLLDHARQQPLILVFGSFT